MTLSIYVGAYAWRRLQPEPLRHHRESQLMLDAANDSLSSPMSNRSSFFERDIPVSPRVRLAGILTYIISIYTIGTLPMAIVFLLHSTTWIDHMDVEMIKISEFICTMEKCLKNPTFNIALWPNFF